MLSDWAVLVHDRTPWTMFILYTSFLLYSYYKRPIEILCGFYVLSSLLFVLQPLTGIVEPVVHAWFTYKVACLVGMWTAEIVNEKMDREYMYIHIGVVLFGWAFGFHPIAGWIVYPLIFSIMSMVSGYYKMATFCIPSLALTSMVSSHVYGVPFISIITPIFGLVPFTFFCPLFPDQIPFNDEV